MTAGITAIVGRDRQCVIVVYVAGSTGNVGVPLCQHETSRAVVECCGVPTDRVVAVHAVGRSERWT
jgi:hypothetical protein